MLIIFFAISLLQISSNSCTVRPVNDLNSIGFLDNLSYESNERTGGGYTNGHKAVCI